MRDGLFQGTTEENSVGLDNLVRKRDLDGSSILLRTGLGCARRNELDRPSKKFPGNYAGSRVLLVPSEAQLPQAFFVLAKHGFGICRWLCH